LRSHASHTIPLVALIAGGALALALALTIAAGVVDAKPKPHKPPKPHPRLTVMTGTEQGVLRREEIKVRIDTNRGSAARVTNHFVVEGYPSDYPFDLTPQTKKFRDHTTVVHFPLSARQREVLDFAIKTCRGATVNLGVTVGRGSGTLSQLLQIPRNCLDTG
jgi:hypothetical protein